MNDAYAIVLHSHLPYVRSAGRWPHGEEWVHEAIIGTYLPLLVALHNLRDDGVRFKITIGLTPSLLEQLADADIDERFLEYIDDQIARVDRDLAELGQAGRSLARLAEHYRSTYKALRDAYTERFARNIVGAFADLARTGQVELLTSAATHGYLPLLDEPSVHRQLAVGRKTSGRHLGFEPTGIWLPECAYRPGLETFLETHGLTHFFTDAALLVGEVEPARRRFSLSHDPSNGTERSVSLRPASTAREFRPYLVADSSVAAVARHTEVSGQVWSALTGYPGDPAYREFHRKDASSGQRYWGVTGASFGLGEKAEYDPQAAADRVRAHARHFAGVIREELAGYREQSGEAGFLTTTFDSELFGHWWFEGVDWLALVLRELSDITVTVAEHLSENPPRERIALLEGSWGKQNDHSTWQNEDNAWMWTELRRMANQFDNFGPLPSDPFRARAARQAHRELLLAQSSDWPFLRTTGQAANYAVERFSSHAQRFARTLELAQSGTSADEAELATIEESDNLFADADLF